MKTPLLAFALSCGLTALDAGTPASADAKNPAVPTATTKTFGGPILERSKLTGDWGGFRDDLAAHGLTFDLNGIYTFQGVAGGGTHFGDGSGNLFSGDLSLALDTGKAGLWPGGFLKFRIETRGGDSVLGRVGSLSPVNNDVLMPNVPGALGDSAWAITELTYAQFLSEKFGVILGLVNTTSGDSNPIAGSLIANDHFLNTGFLYSAPEASVVPTVTLGGGLIFLPSKNVQGTFMVVGSTETAGYNPFETYQGTTFTTEWTFIALTPWAQLTLDAQVVNPAVTRADTAVVLGTRLVIAF